MEHDTERLIAIGDVHGCADALHLLVDAIAPSPADHIVFLGDLIDQGPNTCEVLDLVLDLERRCQVTLIQGNHEEVLLSAREDRRALRFWETVGGLKTINSYHFGGTIADIPPRHWDLLDRSVPFLETDQFIFTHANYLPDVPMCDQPGYQLRWALFDPTAMHPHCSGKPVVVGHTEQLDSEIVDLGFAICLDTACWRYGWLTAMELPSRRLWQSGRFGAMREAGEPTQRGRLAELLQKGSAACD